MTGGIENGLKFDRDGNLIGPAPYSGIAPSPLKIGKGIKYASKLIPLVKQNGVWKWLINGRTASQATLKRYGLLKETLTYSNKASKASRVLEQTISGVPNPTTPLSFWGKVKQSIALIGRVQW